MRIAARLVSFLDKSNLDKARFAYFNESEDRTEMTNFVISFGSAFLKVARFSCHYDDICLLCTILEPSTGYGG